MAISVELFVSPVCDRCVKASKMMKRVVDELGNDRLEWREVDVLDEIDYAVAIGVLSTPAIAIDGKLVFSSLPGIKGLRCALERFLDTKGDNAHDYLPNRRI